MQKQIDMKVVVGLICLAAWCAMEITTLWNVVPPDLAALYFAGKFFANGQTDLIYAAPEGFFGGTPPQWVDPIAASGLGDQVVFPYIYPPLWAAVLAPLSNAMAPHAFFNLFALIEIPMIAASSILAWRLVRRFTMPFWAWLLVSVGLLATSAISAAAIVQLQPQIIVVFLTLLAFERYQSKQWVLAGVLLGVAAMFKLTPAGLALIFLLNRQWRSFAGFVITCAVIAILGLVVVGVDLHLEFLNAIDGVKSVMFITPINFSMQTSVYAALAALGLTPPADLTGHNTLLFGVPTVVSVTTKVMFAVALVWLIRVTAQETSERRLPVQLFCLTLLISLFGPLSWAHYFLVQLVMLPALVGFLAKRAGVILLLITAFVTSEVVYVMLTETFSNDLFIVVPMSCFLLLLFVAVVTKRPRHDEIKQAGVPT
ncbi:glycosyltransferase family 87 protein [Actibacterium lipolyticum]|uniref:DUF2029 domain-containing protein n=1 Tax=Actibacterium lipolyticum TaxID=1524263 RepID=A0A238JM70_9RHOB|nr:glycosyltransferase family 87 protein [Actibacterium lipolyticum]SMX31778.1 hypothetical protein COL8621_00603 [Actibacterium lipolyticum]